MSSIGISVVGHRYNADDGSWGATAKGRSAQLRTGRKLFQEAFEKWKEGVPAGQLEENLIYKRAHNGYWSRRFDDPPDAGRQHDECPYPASNQ
jgi:hypothetical protein